MLFTETLSLAVILVHVAAKQSQDALETRALEDRVYDILAEVGERRHVDLDSTAIGKPASNVNAAQKAWATFVTPSAAHRVQPQRAFSPNAAPQRAISARNTMDRGYYRRDVSMHAKGKKKKKQAKRPSEESREEEDPSSSRQFRFVTDLGNFEDELLDMDPKVRAKPASMTYLNNKFDALNDDFRSMNQIERLQVEDELARVKRLVKNKLSEVSAEQLEEVKKEILIKARDLPGGVPGFGVFDPLGFSTDIDSGRLIFYREVELKHSRVAMLACLGILVGENFHPLFGGDIDVPAYIAFQEVLKVKVPDNFWLAVLIAIAIPEYLMLLSFKYIDAFKFDWVFSMREDTDIGNRGFDPLGLKPEDPKELRNMQFKELMSGRLAMIGAAGMMAKELATGEKIFR